MTRKNKTTESVFSIKYRVRHSKNPKTAKSEGRRTETTQEAKIQGSRPMTKFRDERYEVETRKVSEQEKSSRRIVDSLLKVL